MYGLDNFDFESISEEDEKGTGGTGAGGVCVVCLCG